MIDEVPLTPALQDLQEDLAGACVHVEDEARGPLCAGAPCSKQVFRGLFVAALERYIEVRTQSINGCLAVCSCARDKIQALMEQYVQLSVGKSGRSGCLVVETAVELAISDLEIAERVSVQQKSREMQLRRLIEVAQAEGSVRADIDSVAVARLMLAVQQGMRVLGKTGTSPKAMNSMVNELMRLLD